MLFFFVKNGCAKKSILEKVKRNRSLFFLPQKKSEKYLLTKNNHFLILEASAMCGFQWVDELFTEAEHPADATIQINKFKNLGKRNKIP